VFLSLTAMDIAVPTIPALETVISGFGIAPWLWESATLCLKPMAIKKTSIDGI